jgi:hypothetical protein
MGPKKENAPPLAKIDVLARSDGKARIVDGDVRNYNYLNWMENFADMGHAVILHGLLVRELPEELKPFSDHSVKNWTPLPLEHVETEYGMKTVSVLDTGDPNVKFVNTWSVAMPIHWRFSGVRSGFPPDFTDERQEGGGMIRIIDDNPFRIVSLQPVSPGQFSRHLCLRASAWDAWQRGAKAARQTALFGLGRRAGVGRSGLARVARGNTRAPARTSRNFRSRCRHAPAYLA